MPDENTTDLSTSNAPDLSTEPVEAALSVTTDVEEGRTPDLLPEPVEAIPSITAAAEKIRPPNLSKTKTSVTPSVPSDSGTHKKSRSEPRIYVKWHADALIDGYGVYRGFVKDISLTGTNIFLDYDLPSVKLVKLRIYVPPLIRTSNHHVVEVSGKIIYTAYDSNEFLFRAGVNFHQFNFESDLTYLQSRIANHQSRPSSPI